MKNVKAIRIFATIMAITIITLSSCQKTNEETQDLQDNQEMTSSVKNMNSDESAVLNASDLVMTDVDNLLQSNSLNKATKIFPCNATVDSTDVVDGFITYFITYDGMDCNEINYRQGQVEIKKAVDTKWWMPGASVETTTIDLIVTNVYTGKTVTLNGETTHTNVSGGTVLWLGSIQEVVEHRIEGSWNVTFENEEVESWNIARSKVFFGSLEELYCAFDGFGSENDYDNLVLWGTDREGTAFYTQITESHILSANCDWHAVSGIRTYNIPAEETTVTVTFGFDENDQPIQEGDCPVKFKAEWVQGNNFGTVYIPIQ
jgi:hypothetical protein